MRRAPTSDLRSALRRVKKHLPPANTPGLDAVLGRAGAAPSEGAQLRLLAATNCGGGSCDLQVALESVGRIRLSIAFA